MFKLFLVLLVALGFGLSQPRSRVFILDTAEPILHPVYGFVTNQQLKRIVADLEAHEDDKGELPYGRNGNFQEWLVSEYDNETRRTDAWGNPFELKLEISTFTVISPGPDRVAGTEDDLTASGVRGVTPP